MYQKTVLKNGMRMLSVPKHDTEAVTLFVLFGVGSRYETNDMAGASHFIEHMLFKGTKKRPTARSISRELDAVGADYNAFTSKEYTGYYIRLHADHGQMAADMMHDMVFRSTFKPGEMERERSVILEEIKMYEDNPPAHVAEMLDEHLYRGCSLSRNIAGSRKVVGSLSRKKIMQYWREHYVPEKTVIAVAGKVDDRLVRRVEKLFGSVSKGRKRARKFRCARLSRKKEKLVLKYKETEQAHFAVGFPGFPSHHPSRSALTLLTVALGGGMSSRLFSEVREKRGLAYSIHASMTCYLDVGDFSVQAGLNAERVEEGVRTIMRELRKAARSGLTEEELKRAKEFMKGKIILGLENSSELAEFYSRQELLTGRIETAEEKIATLMKVSREQVKKVAKRVLNPARLSAALIGPYEDGGRIEKLLR